MAHLRLSHIPLRLRLTLWFTISIGVILLLFTTVLYLQIRRSLISQVDAALRVAGSQAFFNVENLNGQLAFQTAAQDTKRVREFSDEYVIYLLAPDGTAVDIITNEDELPPAFDQPPGFQTQLNGSEQWRVYRLPIESGVGSGWIQVAMEMDRVLHTLADLRTQIFWGLPLSLLLAGLGGYFLASRALRPIDNITRTAQAINASDLDQRINYDGPPDEVGRLAKTFDVMLDRLQTAFARERRFTGDAAHELRTPLTALKGRIGVTLSKPRTAPVYVDTLGEMEGQVDRLIHLSNDLLFIARLDQKPSVQALDKIDLSDFVSVLIDQVRPLAAAKSITLDKSIPVGLSLRGNLDLLIRLFLNLLDNAVKFAPENSRVAIEAAENGAFVHIAVSDSGPGIDPEHLPHLFERFYRVEGDRSRQGLQDYQGGAGLGLAIAYEIARAHGGSLTVQSEPGHGTKFIAQFPGSRSAGLDPHALI